VSCQWPAPPVRVHTRAVADEAAHTYTGSLVLGCEKSNPSVHKNYSMIYSSHISWTSPTTPTPLELYPSLAFDRLFKDEVQRGDKSVLDAVLADAQDFRLPSTFADVSNLDREQKPFARDDRRRLFAIGNRLWHSDSSFKAIPAKYSCLRALRIPSKGGNTEFAHMGAAYEALDDETKALIENLVCEHSQLFSRDLIGFTEFTPEERERFKPVRQRLVRTLPATGRKSVYLSSHAGTIVGWPLPEARLLLRDLSEHATQRQFVYSHQWRVHDLVMWDNRQTMHRARPFPAHEPRDMRRTTLKGDGPTVEQIAA